MTSGIGSLQYYVYLLGSRRHGTLYLVVTNDLVRRVHQHKVRSMPGFTTQYGVDRLAWFETHGDPADAIAREKAIKKWRRDWKIRLIEESNPEWRGFVPGHSRMIVSRETLNSWNSLVDLK
jgi:putative endonuclease